jgi:hypothetical protein
MCTTTEKTVTDSSTVMMKTESGEKTDGATTERSGMVPSPLDINLDEADTLVDLTEFDPEEADILAYLSECDIDDSEIQVYDTLDESEDIALNHGGGDVPPPMHPDKFSWPWTQIPEHMRCALAAYIRNGVDPGRTWRAILGGDLRSLWYRLEPTEIACLGSILDFLAVYAPNYVWGSRQTVEWWIALGRGK